MIVSFSSDYTQDILIGLLLSILPERGGGGGELLITSFLIRGVRFDLYRKQKSCSTSLSQTGGEKKKDFSQRYFRRGTAIVVSL